MSKRPETRGRGQQEGGRRQEIGKKQEARGKRFCSRLLPLVSCLLLLVLVLPLPPSAGAVPEASGPGVHLLRSDEQGIVLELQTPNYELAEQRQADVVYQRLSVPGYTQSAEAGRPQLPLRLVLLGVPPEAELELEVTPLQTALVPGYFAICPAPQAVAEQGEDGLMRYVLKDTEPDAAVYELDSFYPAQIARLDDLGFLRSQRLVRLAISPFQINPRRGELKHYPRLLVTVHFRGATHLDSASHLAGGLEPKEFEAALKSLLVNYESARPWRQAPGRPWRWLPGRRRNPATRSH